MDTSEQRGFWHRLRGYLHRRREQIRSKPTLNVAYRVALAVVGTAVLVTGIVLIPYPGPGWLIVFAGLGILATEFVWAQRIRAFARHHYQRWVRWLRRQHPSVVLGIGVLTFGVVVATCWVAGVFGAFNHWFALGWEWLESPLLHR